MFWRLGRVKISSQSNDKKTGQLSLFRTIETGRNRTEPPVNRRLGFEAVPKDNENLKDMCKSHKGLQQKKRNLQNILSVGHSNYS